MTPSNENIESLYQELIQDVSETIQKKLKILRDACDSQVIGKSNDYTIATIGRISQSKSGVSAQTIRNKSKHGKRYRALIDAYSTYYSKPVPKKIDSNNPQYLASCIEDTQTRIMVYELLSKNKKLQNELNMLKSVTEIEIDFRKNTTKIEKPLKLKNQLTEQERAALLNFVSETKLKDLGWQTSTNGRLLEENGKPVTKPFFVDAINKLSLVYDDE